MTKNKKAFIVIGCSGSGKGTQVSLLKEYLQNHDSREILEYEAGDSLREFAKEGSFLGNLVDETINHRGKMLPRFVLVWNWGRRLAYDLKEDMNFIMEGSPRKMDEKKLVDDALHYIGYKDIYVIYIRLGEDEAVRRLLSRGREDDDEQAIRNRLSWFESEVSQTVEDFRVDSKYKFLDINGEQSVEDVHKEIVSKLDF